MFALVNLAFIWSGLLLISGLGACLYNGLSYDSYSSQVMSAAATGSVVTYLIFITTACQLPLLEGWLSFLFQRRSVRMAEWKMRRNAAGVLTEEPQIGRRGKITHVPILRLYRDC